MKIFIIANSCWNILNFRKKLITDLYIKKNKIILSAPIDKSLEKIDKTKFSYLPVNYNRKSFNLIKNLYIILFYIRQFNLYKPQKILLYTIKPNIFCSLATIFTYQKIEIYNFITGLGSLFFSNPFKKKIIIFLYKIALTRSSKVIFQNVDDQNYFLKNKIIPKNKCYIVPGSGIDTNLFKYSELPYTKNENLNFLCLSRIISQKGIIEYVEAANLVKSKFPNVKFNLIGSFDKENLSSININYFNRINKNVNLINFTNNVYNYIKNCDCFVLPSYREGTSMALLEAASVGRPLIATDVPGCNNIVKDNINGYLCNAKDKTSLFEAIIKMINTSIEKRKKMSINSRKIAVDKFDVDIINNEILKLINLDD